MTCQSCVRNITSNLSAVPGITEVVVSLEAGTVALLYDRKVVNPADIPGLITSLNPEKFKASLPAEVNGQQRRDSDVALKVWGKLTQTPPTRAGQTLNVYVDRGGDCVYAAIDRRYQTQQDVIQVT